MSDIDGAGMSDNAGLSDRRLHVVKPPPVVDDPLRTIVAKAVYGLLEIPTRPYEEQPDHIKAMWLEEADAALAAIREGHDIVRKAADD